MCIHICMHIYTNIYAYMNALTRAVGSIALLGNYTTIIYY